MQTLAQSLQDHDRGHLKIIASLWGLELPNETHPKTIEVLSLAMLDGTPAILETLPSGERETLDGLLDSGGKAPMEALVRRYGSIREMGPGKRDRLEPWKDPVSPLEALWYRGLVAKAFADSAGGPQEFGFVPDDLLELLPDVQQRDAPSLGKTAPAPKTSIRSHGFAVDDSTTVIAAYRRSDEVDRDWLRKFLYQADSLRLLEELLYQAELMEHPEHIREYLEMPRDEASNLLQKAWRGSTAWNELSRIAELQSPTGKWPNDPVAGRLAALELLQGVPRETWWSLSEFINAVHQSEPEFMRQPGGFDSWYLQSSADGSSLRGFESWDQVEGRYLKYLITGPMLWLGMAEVDGAHSKFRLISSGGAASNEDIQVAWPDGRIRMGRSANRALRYQIARVCLWERLEREGFLYRLTARSIKAAQAQGLSPSHVLTMLAEVSAPDSLAAAVTRWKKRGEEARIERETVLRVENPQALQMLLEHPTTRRYIAEQLGSSAMVVQERHLRKLEEAALRLGLLISVPDGQSDS